MSTYTIYFLYITAAMELVNLGGCCGMVGKPKPPYSGCDIFSHFFGFVLVALAIYYG